MTKTTVDFIIKFLDREVSSRETLLINCIRNKFDVYINDRIKNYREVFDAREDFLNWVDDQDFKDGEE